jgi:septal ring factor EnvC (AmiA/AmiB activator)
MKNNQLKWAVLSLSAVSLGIAMPSCPGQEAMQQQMTTLQNSNQDLHKKLNAMSTQVTTMNNEVNQMKQLLPQVTNVLQAQKAAIDQLDAAVKGMKGKGGAKGGKKAR